ncbi:MAG: hypothetical protein KY444_00555 [Gemmatimonadetes bacterium]|nr:hypothetical protein [Gemmatimonadota bacterium]
MQVSGGTEGRARVGVAGTKHTTLEFIDGLARHGWRVDHCITLPAETGASQKVAGYLDLRAPLEERGIPWTHAPTYGLRTEADRERLLPLELDLLFVIGWQRLIPEWYLRSLRIGAFGMHGSSRPLPYGRGRSPMNWSLLQNKSAFFTHLFRYEPGVDDGAVVAQQVFDITPWDTALTLHYKNTAAMIQLAAAALPSLLDGTARVAPQDPGGATYYPKRSDEDGAIYWTDATGDIYNLVRAVTHPFPGAFTHLDDPSGPRVTLWRAVPFDSQLRYPGAAPGEVVEVFEAGHFVVKTGTTTLLVLESEGHRFGPRDVGRRLVPPPGPRKVWENVPL